MLHIDTYFASAVPFRIFTLAHYSSCHLCGAFEVPILKDEQLCSHAIYSTIVVSRELHSSDRIGRQGKMDQRPSLNSGPTLYRGVSAMRAIDPSRDPSSPTALMFRSRVCRHPAAA